MVKMLDTLDGTPVSAFAFGTMQFGGKADASQSLAMFQAAREAGINHFDTAFGYTGGASETLLGQFAAPDRDRLFIATKCAHPGNSSAATIQAQVDESRRRLGMDMVDLLYLHRWDDTTPLEETFAALADLRQSGVFRHLGVSNFAAWQVMKAERVAATFGLTIAALQPMYNLVKRQAEVELLPMALSEGFAVFSYSPLGGGLLTGKYGTGHGGRLTDDAMYKARYGQDWMHGAAEGLGRVAAELGVSPITLAAAWAARHPGITAPILSASSAEQLGPSLAAIGLAMDDALYARLAALTPTPAPATDRSEEA